MADTGRRIPVAGRVSAVGTRAEAAILVVTPAANITTEAAPNELLPPVELERPCMELTGGGGGRFADRFASPEAIPVVDRREGAGVHAVDVKSSVQMIDLVLQNPGVPPGCFH